MTLREAFHTVCSEALPPSPYRHLSLYIRTPFFGGPEEGGWWGTDVELVSTQEFPSEDAARAQLELVKELAEHQTHEAKLAWSDHCRFELELAERQTHEAKLVWADHCRFELEQAERRGISPDELRETDGPVEYFVVLERLPGDCSRKDDRFYS